MDIFPDSLKKLKKNDARFNDLLYILIGISGLIFLSSLIYFIKLQFGFYFAIFNLFLVFLLLAAVTYYYILLFDSKGTIDYPSIIYIVGTIILLLASVFILYYEMELERKDLKIFNFKKLGYENLKNPKNIKILKSFKEIVGNKKFNNLIKEEGADVLLNNAKDLKIYREIVGDLRFNNLKKEQGVDILLNNAKDLKIYREIVGDKKFNNLRKVEVDILLEEVRSKLVTVKELVKDYRENRDYCETIIIHLGGGVEGDPPSEKQIEDMKKIINFKCDPDSKVKLAKKLAKKHGDDFPAAEGAISNLYRFLKIGLEYNI